jgi:hypothetical protein
MLPKNSFLYSLLKILKIAERATFKKRKVGNNKLATIAINKPELRITKQNIAKFIRQITVALSREISLQNFIILNWKRASFFI